MNKLGENVGDDIHKSLRGNFMNKSALPFERAVGADVFNIIWNDLRISISTVLGRNIHRSLGTEFNSILDDEDE